MKTLTKYILLYICVFTGQLFAQDIIRMNLTSNPVLIDKSNELLSKGIFRSSSSPADTIKLDINNNKGILDDFSYTGPYPDSSIWLDKYVFVNRNYAYSPPTIGVATFDGLDERGYPYDFSVDQFSSRLSDYLTSKPIDLNFPVADSIYFSFYYQPQGLGNAPAPRDSLVLEFKAPGGSWNGVWAKSGSGIVFKDTLKWKFVLIPITNPDYLKKGFQFRFKNYATISGNLDHWHIDYVYLNVNRKITDTFMDDVSYVYNCPSLIKTYQRMPWRQYTPADAKPFVLTPLRVNSGVDKNVNRTAEVMDQTGGVLKKWKDSDNIQPFSQVGYTKDSVIIPQFPLMTGPTSYYAQAVLSTTPDKERRNDTLLHEQKFGNYFAYDDGTAESAFGLNTANALLAVKFEMNVQDTLRYVDIYFNPLLTNAENLTFNLKVWGNDGDKPGPDLFTSQLLKPHYTKTGQNGFMRYSLNTSFILAPGIFYVGIIQQSNLPLGIGQDLNTNNQLNTFYNVGDHWDTFPYPGTAMIHPVFGQDTAITAVNDLHKQTNVVKIYPNPATTSLNVVSTDTFIHKVQYTIVDLYGREIATDLQTTPMVIDILNLSKGVYFIRFSENNATSTFKFIKIE